MGNIRKKAQIMSDCDVVNLRLKILTVFFIFSLVVTGCMNFYSVYNNKIVSSDLIASLKEYKKIVNNNDNEVKQELTRLVDRVAILDNKVDILSAISEKKDASKK